MLMTLSRDTDVSAIKKEVSALLGNQKETNWKLAQELKRLQESSDEIDLLKKEREKLKEKLRLKKEEHNRQMKAFVDSVLESSSQGLTT